MLYSIGYIWQYLVQTTGLIIAFIAAGVLIFIVLRKHYSRNATLFVVLIFLGISIFFYVPNGLPNAFQYPFSMKTFGPSDSPVLPFKNVVSFFRNFSSFVRVENISVDPNEVSTPIDRENSKVVKFELTTKEVISEIASGIYQNYWTFDGTVPGPFLRVREGDTVELTLKNDESSLHHHSIDLHAVTGPGGGAAATIVEPGESKTIKFKAMHAGIFIYHCAHPNVALHMAHGMYGLILVEPKVKLPAVDKEFYIVQGELYTTGALGKKGLQIFDPEAMLNSQPQYIVFNGKTGALINNMNVKVGDRVRIYVGNGGVNLVSSFHLIGEVFDRVYREGDLLSEPARSLQTTLIPAGGAVAVEFLADYPGKYILVDHALSRLDRGAWGIINVSGEKNTEIFEGEIMEGGGH